MEVPKAVIAQAEAAASTNQSENRGRQAESTTKEAKGGTLSEGSHDSPKNDQVPARGSKPFAVHENPIENVPQLAYGPQLGQVDFSQDGFDTEAKVAGMEALQQFTPSSPNSN